MPLAGLWSAANLPHPPPSHIQGTKGPACGYFATGRLAWELQMVDQWSSWKKFPEPQRGEHLDAPLGPGIYELRRATSGENLGFGHSPNVAATLTRQMAPSFWARW